MKVWLRIGCELVKESVESRLKVSRKCSQKKMKRFLIIGICNRSVRYERKKRNYFQVNGVNFGQIELCKFEAKTWAWIWLLKSVWSKVLVWSQTVWPDRVRTPLQWSCSLSKLLEVHKRYHDDIIWLDRDQYRLIKNGANKDWVSATSHSIN